MSYKLEQPGMEFKGFKLGQKVMYNGEETIVIGLDVKDKDGFNFAISDNTYNIKFKKSPTATHILSKYENSAYRWASKEELTPIVEKLILPINAFSSPEKLLNFAKEYSSVFTNSIITSVTLDHARNYFNAYMDISVAMNESLVTQLNMLDFEDEEKVYIKDVLSDKLGHMQDCMIYRLMDLFKLDHKLDEVVEIICTGVEMNDYDYVIQLLEVKKYIGVEV